MAVPIRDGGGRIVAALNVSAATIDGSPQIADAERPLLACAAAITADLAAQDVTG